MDSTRRRSAVRTPAALLWDFAVLMSAACLLLPSSVQAATTLIYTHEAGYWGGGATTELNCPADTLLVGIREKTGQWLARVTLLCQGVSSTGNWSGGIVEGPTLGGDGGNRLGTVQCPPNMFVAAFAAEVVRVLAENEIYVAFPAFTCVSLRTGATDHVGGPLGVYLGIDLDAIVMGDREIDGNYGCTKGWAARGLVMRAAEDDDIDRFGLVCESRTQYATQPIPNLNIASYLEYTPAALPVESPPAPSPGGIDTTYLFCPSAGTRLVGWNVDPDVRGVKTVSTICAPVTRGVGWSGGTEVGGDSWLLTGSSAGALRKYVCPADAVVVGAAMYFGLYKPVEDAAPICRSELDGSISRVMPSGMEPRGPVDSITLDCLPSTNPPIGGFADGPFVQVTSSNTTIYVGIGCPQVLYVAGDNTIVKASRGVGPCVTQPQLCATTSAPSAPPPPTVSGTPCPRVGATFRVFANVRWCDTGIKLVGKGERLLITGRGQWSNSGPPSRGPEGFANYKLANTLLPTADLASLIAQIANRLFYVGTRYDAANATAGTLFLSINDMFDAFGDNQGYVDVLVQVGRGP